jgi:acetylornithine deacetylase/succinyl-diaminopimelate desuccinylase-like protein
MSKDVAGAVSAAEQADGRAAPAGDELHSAVAEATELLQRLIRFDTVNPPGNERGAQEHLAGHLRDAGFECELLGRTEERPNLIARLPAEGDRGTRRDGPTLCLLSHMDTVLADPDAWSHDPWSGDLADGCVWGRGALDMKHQTAAEVAAVCALAREGWRPAQGELLVVCVVDEETGGAEGAMWLCETHPDRVRCDYLINEGGGWRVPYGEQVLYGVGCAEKGVFRFSITTRGVAGHASMPYMGENALLKLVPFLERMRDRQPAPDLTEEARTLLATVGEDPDGDLIAAVERVRARDSALGMMVAATLGVTLAPTRIFASEKINVIPSTATLAVDCRVPPALGEEHVLRRIREVLGQDGYELRFLEQVVGNRSPFDSPLVEHIREWVSEREPGASCVPSVLPGFTDSRTFRDAFPDCHAYGFFPHRHMPLALHGSLVHGADERIDVRDLAYATDFFDHLTRRVLG